MENTFAPLPTNPDAFRVLAGITAAQSESDLLDVEVPKDKWGFRDSKALCRFQTRSPYHAGRVFSTIYGWSIRSSDGFNNLLCSDPTWAGIVRRAQDKVAQGELDYVIAYTSDVEKQS